MICSVQNCERTVRTRGLCNMHYQRQWKHGDPEKLARSSPGSGLDWLKANIGYDGDECLIWPFGGSHGYGALEWRGRKDYAHRVMCEIAHGPAPKNRPEAAHSCGKGKTGCCSPIHLRWATRQENEGDKVAHGTIPRGERCPLAKLTETQALEIKAALSKGEKQQSIADRFHVIRQTISAIKRGKSWAHLGADNIIRGKADRGAAIAEFAHFLGCAPRDIGG